MLCILMHISLERTKHYSNMESRRNSLRDQPLGKRFSQAVWLKNVGSITLWLWAIWTKWGGWAAKVNALCTTLKFICWRFLASRWGILQSISFWINKQPNARKQTASWLLRNMYFLSTVLLQGSFGLRHRKSSNKITKINPLWPPLLTSHNPARVAAFVQRSIT